MIAINNVNNSFMNCNLKISDPKKDLHPWKIKVCVKDLFPNYSNECFLTSVNN